MGAHVLDVVSIELEKFIRQIFEPDMQIATYPVRSGIISAWGAVEIGYDHSKCQISTTYDDKWSYCPRYSGDDPQPILFDLLVSGDGVVIYDTLSGQHITHTFENPKFFENVLDHIWDNIDFMLRIVQVRLEWIVSSQVTIPELGDATERLAVLKEKMKLFEGRYRSIRL